MKIYDKGLVKMPKQRITTAINKVLNEQFGFEIYIVMKGGE